MVEWKKLGEIMTIVRGASPRPITNYITNDADGVNWIKIGDVASDAKYITSSNEKITKEGAAKSRFLHSGDFILSNSMSFGRPYILKIDGCIHDGWIAMSDFEQHVSSGYLYEILNSNKVQDYWKMKANNGGAMTNLNSDIVRQTIIPIPSLSEQSRIVSILDTFTSSISNLKQQIEERRKQYEYERDLLLDLEGKEGVEMKKLGECVLFITDGDHQPPPKSSEGIPFVTISDIEKLSHTIDFSNTFFVPQEYYNSLKSDKKAKKGDVLYTVTGSFGIPVLIEDNREFCFQRHIALIRPNNTIALSRYIYHWLCSNYAKKQGEEKASGGAQKTVSLNSLRSFRFYYPPLQAQSRIVSILDTFEQSISNLEEQLAMREKQYEYYRNQLLTFEGEEERGKT